jgi:hypothetical protein
MNDCCIKEETKIIPAMTFLCPGYNPKDHFHFYFYKYLFVLVFFFHVLEPKNEQKMKNGEEAYFIHINA